MLGTLLVTLLLTVQPSGSAQEEVLVEEVTGEATLGNGQRKVIRHPSGALYAIYSAPLQATDAVFVARSEDGGTTWREEELLSRAGIRAGLGTLELDAEGRLHAGWVDYETVGHVWHAVRTETWSVPEKISPGPDYAGFPAMVADRRGLHVLWYGAKPNSAYSHGSEYEIEHTYLTASGWSVPDLVSVGSFDALNPTAAAGPDDAVVSAWYQRSGEVYRTNVARWDGTGWEVPKTVSPPTDNAVAVSMDIGPEGTVHMVWQQFRGDIPGIAYAAFRDGEWTDPEVVAAGPAANPVVASEADGRVVAAWSTGAGVEARRRNGSWSSPIVLGAGDHPALLPGDPVHVLWTRPRGNAFELAFAPATFPSGPSGLVIAAIAVVVVSGGLLLLRRRKPR